jgi:hypothetical protein
VKIDGKPSRLKAILDYLWEYGPFIIVDLIVIIECIILVVKIPRGWLL